MAQRLASRIVVQRIRAQTPVSLRSVMQRQWKQLLSFLVSRISEEKQLGSLSFPKETTRNDSRIVSFLPETTRNDQKRHNQVLKLGVGAKGWMGVWRQGQGRAQEVGTWLMRGTQAKQKQLFIRLFTFSFLVSPSQLQKQKSVPRNDGRLDYTFNFTVTATFKAV